MNRTAVCYLLVNQIPEMPTLAVESMLKNCDSDVYLGYVNERDLPEIAKDPRIKLVKLSLPQELATYSSPSEYLPFDRNDFFKLVALKWQLFLEIFELGYEVLIYSDLDVMVFGNISDQVNTTFEVFPGVDVLIQDATTSPSDPRLCMGLIAMRQNDQVKKMIQVCYENHIQATNDGSRVGDDDIITKFYLQAKNFEWIMRLPQVTYPVGQYLNLFSKKDVFPGLKPVKPQIFHSNYVIGRENKIALMKVSASRIDYFYSLPISLRLTLLLKRVRLQLGTILRLYKPKWYSS